MGGLSDIRKFPGMRLRAVRIRHEIETEGTARAVIEENTCTRGTYTEATLYVKYASGVPETRDLYVWEPVVRPPGGPECIVTLTPKAERMMALLAASRHAIWCFSMDACSLVDKSFGDYVSMTKVVTECVSRLPEYTSLLVPEEVVTHEQYLSVFGQGGILGNNYTETYRRGVLPYVTTDNITAAIIDIRAINAWSLLCDPHSPSPRQKVASVMIMNACLSCAIACTIGPVSDATEQQTGNQFYGLHEATSKLIDTAKRVFSGIPECQRTSGHLIAMLESHLGILPKPPNGIFGLFRDAVRECKEASELSRLLSVVQTAASVWKS